MNIQPLRYVIILLLSLCVHLALLLVPVSSTRHGTAGRAVLQVRLNVPVQSESTAQIVPDTVQHIEQSSESGSITETSEAHHAPDVAAEASAPPALAEPTYYSSLVVDEKPRILEDPLTEAARHLPSEAVGHLVLRLLISDTGSMDKVIVEKSDVNAAFLPQLEQAAEAMRFTPGRIKGKEVRTEMRISVEIDSLRQLPGTP